MSVVAGAVLPHAPLLLPEVTEVRWAPEVVASVQAAISDEAEVVAVISPHGKTSGVYAAAEGSLAGQGLPNVRFKADPAPVLAEKLADLWGRPLIEGDIDHGVGVPLRLAAFDGSIVGVALRETTGPAGSRLPPVLEDARALAGSLEHLSVDLGVVASAHTAASLSPRAPLTDLPEGHGLDGSVLAALGTDVGGLTEISAQQWRNAGSCGAGPLTVLGLLFPGARARVHAYDHPVGVGYVVATVERV
jgi:aromatic ring-opening dioxygenase LigB subunit